MALPQQFANHNDYFEQCLRFLRKYRWLHNTPNTNILANKILDNFPTEWLDFFKEITSIDALNKLVSDADNKTAPETLKTFFTMVKTLTPNYTRRKFDPVSLTNVRRLNQKKIHEITNLAPVIHAECSKLNITHIIDVGSGLGYLPQLLYEKYGYKVLGIEGNKTYVETATKIQNANSKTSVCYKNHFVTSDSAEEIKNLFLQHFNDFDVLTNKLCMIALHACADLTVHIINIVNQLPFVKCSVVMPCCYHRIEGGVSKFVNFPLSAELKEVYGSFGREFLTRPFLRLACQQSGNFWKSMDREARDLQTKNCLFRNLLQEVVEEEKIQISRRKRKTGGKPSECTIENFVKNLSTSYKFSWTDSGDVIKSEKLEDIKNSIQHRYLHEYRDTECLIEVFVALQAAIQGVCENLVLLDRCAYANSLGLTCRTEQVTDDCVSPRCYAFLMTKG